MNETIYKALAACLGIFSDSAQTLSLIRQAYTEPENSPQPARSADVVYWSLSPETTQDPASYNETAAASGTHKPTVHRYLPYQLLVVCYGPGCEMNAKKIRSFLYLDGAGLPRQILRKAGIYPVPEPVGVQLFYEPEGSLWRRRADVVISLRVREEMVYSAERNAISTPPEVEIYS